MTSHCRGENRITSAPNREMSNRDAAVAISSIAQQARPIGIGQREFLRTQFSAASNRVKITLPSIFESYAVARVSGMPKPNAPQFRRKVDVRTINHLGNIFSQMVETVLDQ